MAALMGGGMGLRTLRLAGTGFFFDDALVFFFDEAAGVEPATTQHRPMARPSAKGRRVGILY
jgi:hypothetical protein